mgnify:CR=1 FL=1
MFMRTRVGALAALAVTGLALGATLATPAEAAPKAPGFLAAADLPPHPSSAWTAGKVTRGVGEEGLGVCAKTAVPAHSSAWNRDFRTELEMEVGQRPAWAVESFRDVDQDVRQSMQRVRTSPFLLHTDDVRGFVFDVKTGLLREVDPL